MPFVPVGLFLVDCGAICVGMKEQLVTKAAVDFGAGGIELDGAAAKFDRFFNSPGIFQNVGEIVEDFGLIRILGKDPAINVFGVV